MICYCGRGEYINNDMSQFLSVHGMLHQTSCHDTPQKNGVAERKNRTLLTITRAFIIESRVPISFCAEAIATATYLTNCLPFKPLHYKTPLDTLSSFVSIPSYHSLFPPRVFGCVVYVHLPQKACTKFESRAVKCVFLGYGVNHKCYRCFDPIHNRLYTSMDCDFFEQSYYYSQPRPQGENVSNEDLRWLTHPLVIDPDPKEQVGKIADVVTESIVSPPLDFSPVLCTEHPEMNSEEVILKNEVISDNPEVVNISDHVVSNDTLDRYEAQRSRYPISRDSDKNLSQAAVAYNVSLYSNTVPRNIEEALQNSNWKNAMEEEILALDKNET